VFVDGNERIPKSEHTRSNNGQLAHHFDVFAVEAHIAFDIVGC
jgi:hypothetical protein